MNLNTIKPAPHSKSAKKRVGRGIGSGYGKTCGKGHKGQKSRSGGYHKIGFEGGQMPLQMRLPKSGFRSRKKQYVAEIRLGELNNVQDSMITMENLRKSGLINHHIKDVKLILSGKITKAIQVSGIKVTAGAAKAIEAAGGKVESQNG